MAVEKVRLLSQGGDWGEEWAVMEASALPQEQRPVASWRHGCPGVECLETGPSKDDVTGPVQPSLLCWCREAVHSRQRDLFQNNKKLFSEEEPRCRPPWLAAGRHLEWDSLF